jgi:hypothetical protein
MSQISADGEHRSTLTGKVRTTAPMGRLARQSNDSEVAQNVRNWPEADDLGVAASRQLSGVQRPCGQRRRSGRI